MNAFYNLVGKALASSPVSKGQYKKDGWFYASVKSTTPPGAKAPWGKDDTVLITVVNGTIVDSIWNGIVSYKGYDPSKLVISAADKRGYPMLKTAVAKWHVQSAAADEALVKTQDPNKLDAISGCTIYIKDFVTAANTALKAAK
jgi:major membrane immunogen (membrane-anchored lipoprotein)